MCNQLTIILVLSFKVQYYQHLPNSWHNKAVCILKKDSWSPWRNCSYNRARLVRICLICVIVLLDQKSYLIACRKCRFAKLHAVKQLNDSMCFVVCRNSFQKFYQEYLAAAHPTEDFYLEWLADSRLLRQVWITGISVTGRNGGSIAETAAESCRWNFHQYMACQLSETNYICLFIQKLTATQ